MTVAHHVSLGRVAAPVIMRPNLLALSFAPVPAASLGADVPIEAPLPEPEGERVQVWREGYGWVERPAVPFEVDVPEVPRRESAVAA